MNISTDNFPLINNHFSLGIYCPCPTNLTINVIKIDYVPSYKLVRFGQMFKHDITFKILSIYNTLIIHLTIDYYNILYRNII